MTPIRTTYDCSARDPFQVIPRLTDREVAAIWQAVEDGDLLAIVNQVGPYSQAHGSIVAVATPEIAERLTSHDPDTAGELLAELREAKRELDNLRQITRETMNERDPAAWSYRIDNAADDVETAIKHATDLAETL